MKNFIFICLIIILTFLAGISSCKRSGNPVKPENTEYIVFGDFYGECAGGNCVHIFKIENDTLYSDTLRQYPARNDYYRAKWVKMPDAKQKLIDSLIFNFPSKLLTDTNNVFGMPDAYDQGGIYLEMEKMNEDYINFWIIDNDTKNIPDYLREFTKQIQKNIQILVK